MESNVQLTLLNLDETYKSLDYKIDLLTAKPEVVDKLTISEFKNMLVPLAPQCMCGVLKGTAYKNEKCFECGTIVTDYLGNYSSLVWVSAPDNMKFISPLYWSTLNFLITASKFDSLAYLSNTRYKSTLQIPKIIKQFTKDNPNYIRSYDSLLDNLEYILNYLNTKISYSKRDRVQVMLDMYNNDKDKVFCTYLPIPNKQLFLLEDSSFSTRKVSLTTGIIKSMIINYIENIKNNRDPGNSITRIIAESAEAFNVNIAEMLNGKRKIPRSSIYGSKAPLSFRTVMLPLDGPHRYDECHMPWVEAVINFRPVLLNKLVRYHKMRYMEATIYLDKHLYVYSELIDSIFQSMIKEFQDQGVSGIPITMQRNPSQYKASIILLFIPRVKTDPLDFSTEYSPLLCASFNGDF